jgi:hypothetical protein
VRAFNSLSVSVMADDNHREPPWVLFLSGDQQAKPAVARLIRDAGFDPVDLGGIDDSQLQDPGSALWTYALTHDEATALVARINLDHQPGYFQNARLEIEVRWLQPDRLAEPDPAGIAAGRLASPAELSWELLGQGRSRDVLEDEVGLRGGHVPGGAEVLDDEVPQVVG